MSLLDFYDRWTLAGVLTLLQADLKLSDAEAGSLNSFFLIAYSVVAPLMGWLGDRVQRTRLLALGVAVWSMATVGTGLANNLFELRLARSILGIGEATYGVLAPSILTDLFPRTRRARMLSLFLLGMPLGYALGIKLGGWIAETFGDWRIAFFVAGTPGFVAALSALLLPEPIRGLSEGLDPEALRRHQAFRPSKQDYKDLMVNSSFTYTVFGLAAYTFAFGGLAFWLESFLVRVRGFDKGYAGTLVASTGFLAAILGMIGGGWLADRLQRRLPGALLLVSGSSMLLAVPCILAGLLATEPVAIGTWMFLAQFLLFANAGPSNAVIAAVVLPNMRATAYAINTFCIHFLGDVWSPLLMGAVSDYFGRLSVMQTPPGQLLARLGFVPVRFDGQWRNLGAGMLVVVPAVLLGAIVLLAGVRHLPREMALMRARLQYELAREELKSRGEIP
ncbi:MAG: MFS transporter [Isosphaeraceae bacterium]|jgi:MFS family permease|nr:MAG: MFS transporter [Isosphaeraceae bacterium]